MFGKKKELKLKGRINDILERIKETKNNLQGKNEIGLENDEKLSQTLNTAMYSDEDIKREINYIGIISAEAIKELEVQSELIEAQSSKARKLTEAVKDKEVFDTERVSRSTEQILDGIKNGERSLSAIREEVRGLEVIGVSLKDIANQTSALSLNAAIMGARLENGNDGFVQTATEIKELASECVRTVVELNRRLESIQNKLDEMDKENQTLREAAGDSNTAASAINKAYGEISEKFSDDNSEKNANLKELIEKLKDLNESITGLGENQENKLSLMSELVKMVEIRLEDDKELGEIILDIDKIL